MNLQKITEVLGFMRRMKVLFVAGVLLMFSTAVLAAEIVVLPIDRAKFLSGQEFDLEVELRGALAD